MRVLQQRPKDFFFTEKPQESRELSDIGRTDRSGHGRPNHVTSPRTSATLVSAAFYHPIPFVTVVHLAGSYQHNRHAVHPTQVVFEPREEEGFGPCRRQQRSQKDIGSAVRS